MRCWTWSWRNLCLVDLTAPERPMKESGKRLHSDRTQDMIEEGLCCSVTNVEDKDAVDGHFTREKMDLL